MESPNSELALEIENNDKCSTNKWQDVLHTAEIYIVNEFHKTISTLLAIFADVFLKIIHNQGIENVWISNDHEKF